tara:strand:+ start:249 stop:464 length:216 start_codon:yes stop_codon:yes gene_type:complete
MNKRSAYLYSLIAPCMLLLAIIGFTFRSQSKKPLYLPMGIIGFYLIIEKEFNRRSKRKDILKKVKFFLKNK